uniref:Uncharacterized protein n=1 Tax=Anguilla anguilla TaxID=7936 RepID=A0A0E9RE65_ANGAN
MRFSETCRTEEVCV